MEELMRFVSIRPAETVPDEPAGTHIARLSIRSDSNFQGELDAADDPKKPDIAKRFTQRKRFVADLGALKIPVASPRELIKIREAAAAPFESFGFLKSVYRQVVNAEVAPPDSEQEIVDVVTNLINGNRWSEERSRIFDSYLSLAYFQPDKLGDSSPYDAAVRSVYLFELIAGPSFNEQGVNRVLSSVIDPKHEFPVIEFEEIEPEPDDDDQKKQQQALALEAGRLKNASDFIKSIDKSSLKLVTQISEEFDDLVAPKKTKNTSRSDDKDPRQTAKNAPQGTRIFKETATYHLDQKAIGKAGKEIQPVVKSYLSENGEAPLESISFAMLHDEKMLFQNATPLFSRQVKGTRLTPALANNYVLADFSKYNDMLLNPGYSITPELFIPEFRPLGIGPRFGSIGIGDLLIVKQNLKEYEALDVAHIENILRGELKERVHQRKRLTEETYLTESESEVEEERDTQTSERFELKSEVSEELNEKLNFEAGLKVTAQLGPMVELEADTKFAYENAKTESRKKATSFSKETTERASSRFAERVLERRERRLVEEVIEKNTHRINAETYPNHSSGVYQWVNKIYQAQVFNYGIRQMYEFFIPEPALYYIRSLISQAMTDSDALSPPPTFNITPDTILRSNYKTLAGIYKASDVPEPPELFIKVDSAQAGGPLDFDSTENGNVASAFSIQLPDGYEYHGYRSSYRYTYRGDEYDFRVTVSENFGDPGTVPYYVKGRSIVSWATWVHVTCRLTQSAEDAWRISVWEALKDAHDQMQREYEDELAAAAVQEGVEITGRNPGSNQRIIKDELIRQCISALTNESPAGNNGISGTGGVPTINWSQAFRKGSYARFMHHAFEWENISYVFYPYFWSRADRWLELFNIEDPDPDFQAFLQSGIVRVVVPVRPGFEGHVEYFKRNNKIWSGNQPPMIGDDDFLSIAAEIQNNTGAPGDEEPVGDPWDIRVPTQLVHLRKDDKLPRWTQNDEGEWIEVVEE